MELKQKYLHNQNKIFKRLKQHYDSEIHKHKKQLAHLEISVQNAEIDN